PASPSSWTRSRPAPVRRRRRRSSCGRGAMPLTSESGCAACPASLWSLPTAHRARSPMTSSRWQAHGNVYLVAESEEYVMEPELDGVMQVLSTDGDDITVAIVNPDGSLAEMSGNGT